MLTTVVLALVLVATSALTVVAVLLLSGLVRRPGGEPRHQDTPATDAMLLFEDRVLIDTNAVGAALLDSLRGTSQDAAQDDWALLTRFLTRRFGDVVSELAQTGPGSETTLCGADGLELRVQRRGGTLRLTVIDTGCEGGSIRLDRLSYRAMRDELALLRRMTESAPLMMWRESPEGQVIWANGCYLHHATSSGTDTLSWPLPSLFADPAESVRQRLTLTARGAKPVDAWFDLQQVDDGANRMVYALPADAAQKAERTKREFVQTLTKTFATLPIGLAVFDRTRRLQIFNPALADLTGLETEFLLSRPGIEGFLNRMRDKRVLPEPRDYRSWRKRLLDIETTGPSGEFEETWTLPDGQIFRVSVSPHPDGALAFLVEDITSETHLTRNVRAEAETSQAVLNQLDTAIAVFAPGGQLVLTNTAFSRLWTLEGEESLSGVTLAEALENWREAGDDPALWLRIGALARAGGTETEPIRGTMRLSDGECLQVEGRRTSTGAVMIAFAQDRSDGRHHPGTAEPRHRAQILRASA